MAVARPHTASGKLLLTFCRDQNLLVLPRVGKKAAKIISKYRDLHGYITVENVFEIPKLNPTQALLQLIDFTSNPEYVFHPGEKKYCEAKRPFLIWCNP